MLSPRQRQDKNVRATDLDALSCRSSANRKGYFNPPDVYIDELIISYNKHLQFCSGYTNLSASRTLRSVFNEQKFPLINRGTYLRTKVLYDLVSSFCKEFAACQIISLGGGSDTKSFQWLENIESVRVIEIDFVESVKIKKLAILNSPKLSKVVGQTSDESVIISSHQSFESLDPEFHADRYHLIGCDLREIKEKSVSDNLYKCIDTSLPTLVLSECVLCYLSPEENKMILNNFSEAFLNKAYLSFLIYEPMSLNDTFGTTMTNNLSNRGLNLYTFDHLPDLTSRYKFMHDECCIPNVKLTDMSTVAGYEGIKEGFKPWIDDADLLRINKLELVDEIEEIKLLFRHYCLCYAELPYGDKHFRLLEAYHWRI